VEKCCRAGQATTDNMAHAHCMLGTKGYRNTLSEYVPLIAFLLQQCLHERASTLRYTYIACLVIRCILEKLRSLKWCELPGTEQN